MNQPTSVCEPDLAHPSAEGPVLLHVWMIDPGKAEGHVRSLDELFSRIASQPGFVSARILESPDKMSVAALVNMRSATDRQRLERLPEVRETLRHLRANVILRLYDVVGASRGAEAPDDRRGLPTPSGSH